MPCRLRELGRKVALWVSSLEYFEQRRSTVVDAFTVSEVLVVRGLDVGGGIFTYYSVVG